MNRWLLILIVIAAAATSSAQEITPDPDEKAVEIGKKLAIEAMKESHTLFGDVREKDVAVLIAEGDSWFDYPELTWKGGIRQSGILKVLETRHGYDVRSVAHHGHTLESMTYDVSQLADMARELEKIKKRSSPPLRAILLSAGGNDIAGPELGVLLNHVRADEKTVIDEVIAREIFDVRIKNQWISLLSAVTSMSTEFIGKPMPIVIHGYDYPIPDGRGYHGGGWILPGPWLKPAFTRKGYEFRDPNDPTPSVPTTEMANLIRRYAAVIERVIEHKRFDHVHFVRTPGVLKEADYHDDWANELHPTEKGFRTVAACIDRALQAIGAGSKQKMFDCK